METEDYDVSLESIKKSSKTEAKEHKKTRKTIKINMAKHAVSNHRFTKQGGKYTSIKKYYVCNYKLVFKHKKDKAKVRKYAIKVYKNIAKSIKYSKSIAVDKANKDLYVLNFAFTHVDGLSVYEAKLTSSEGKDLGSFVAENKLGLWKVYPKTKKWANLKKGEYKLIITRKYYGLNKDKKGKDYSKLIYFIKKEIKINIDSDVINKQKENKDKIRKNHYFRNIALHLNKSNIEKLKVKHDASAKCIEMTWMQPNLKYGIYAEYKDIEVFYLTKVDGKEKFQNINNDKTFSSKELKGVKTFDKKVCKLPSNAKIIKIKLNRDLYKTKQKKEKIVSLNKNYFFVIK